MRHEAASRRTAAGMALALLVFVLAAMALAACGGREGEKATPSPAPPASPTATATNAATATATAAARATATPRPSPTAQPTPTPAPTPKPQFTAAPAPSPTQVLVPSWQTSAPREPAPAGELVELGIRNENGAPGESYAIGVQVNLPDGSYVNREGQVVGTDWAYFSIGETDLPGTYTVYFGVPQSDIIYAEDSFEVYAPGPPPGGDFTNLTWQTSAPRVPVAIGEVVDLGLRNKYGEPGECYDFLMEVSDPLGEYASAEGTVCADEWADLTYEDTYLSGTYDVYFSIEGQLIAQDSFEVERVVGP